MLEELLWADTNTFSFVTNDPDMTLRIRASVFQDLPQDQQEEFHSVLLARQESFAESSKDLGYCKVLLLNITTQDVKPIHPHPYPSVIKQRALLQQ